MSKNNRADEDIEYESCPLCGELLLPDCHYCYECNTLLTDNCKQKMPAESVTNKELLELIQLSKEDQAIQENTFRYKLTNKLGTIFLATFILGIILAIISATRVFGLILTIGSMIIVFLASVFSPSEIGHMLTEEQLKGLVNDYLVPAQFKDIFHSNVIYQPEEGLPEELLIQNPFYYTHYNSYEGSQYIQGEYRNYPFEMSYVYLKVSTTQNGTKRESDLFTGRCIHLKTDIHIPSTINVTTKYSAALKSLSSDFNDAATFDTLFKVKCDDPAVEQSLLTSEMRLKILSLIVKYGYFGFVIQPDGQFFISVEEHDNLEDKLENIENEDDFNEIRSIIHKNLSRPLIIFDSLVSEIKTTIK